jgi:hypothetical protein
MMMMMMEMENMTFLFFVADSSGVNCITEILLWSDM